MSALLIRAALEVALASVGTNFPTAWENVPFTPTQGTAYQAVFLLLAPPANDEFGAIHREEGYLQINLNYPLGDGPKNAATRAEAIRSTFTRGATFTASGVKVHITRTPEIAPAMIEEDRYVLPVKVRFHAHITGS